MTETFEDDFLIPRRITNDKDYPASEANFVSVKDYISYLEANVDFMEKKKGLS